MKGMVYLSATIGGIIGAYLPALFHQNSFMVSAIGSLIGGIVGIWAAVKFADYF